MSGYRSIGVSEYRRVGADRLRHSDTPTHRHIQRFASLPPPVHRFVLFVLFCGNIKCFKRVKMAQSGKCVGSVAGLWRICVGSLLHKSLIINNVLLCWLNTPPPAASAGGGKSEDMARRRSVAPYWPRLAERQSALRMAQVSRQV